MASYEYSTALQSNLNWGESFRMAVKAPAIADRIFKTWDDANEYIHDKFNSAIAGLVLSVIEDDINKNGSYFIDSIARTEGYVDDFGNVYHAGEKELVMVRLASFGGDRHVNWTEEDPTSDTYIKNKPHHTDTTKNKISVVRRADMVNGQFFTDRTEVVSDDEIVYMLRDGAEYTLYGYGKHVPYVLIVWTEGVNQFPSIADANDKYKDVEISGWPEYLRIGNPLTYTYHKLSYSTYKIGINTDNKSIIKTGGFISVHSPEVRIRSYHTLEDDGRIIYCKIKQNSKYEYVYMEVDKSEYEYTGVDGEQHDKVQFNEVDALDDVVSRDSYLFVHTTSDDKFYRRCDLVLSSIINEKTGTEIVYTHEMDDKLFFVDGRTYQIIKNLNGEKYLAQKIVFNDDSIVDTLESFEKMIYLNDMGTY